MRDLEITEGCKRFFSVSIWSITLMCSSELVKCLLIIVGRYDVKLKFPTYRKGIKTISFFFFLMSSKTFYESTMFACSGCSPGEVKVTGTSQNCACWEVPWRNHAFSVQKYTLQSLDKYGRFIQQSSGSVVTWTAMLNCSVAGHRRRIVKGRLSEVSYSLPLLRQWGLRLMGSFNSSEDWILGRLLPYSP